MAELPGRLAAYELLGMLAAAHPGAVRLVRWERPFGIEAHRFLRQHMFAGRERLRNR